MPRVVENAAGRFWRDDEGILRCDVTPGYEQTREDAEDSLRIFTELAAGRPRPTVIVVSGVRSLGREARGIYTGPRSAAAFAAVAIVTESSLVARTLVNFIMAVSRPAYPMRMCETLDEALAWARTQLRGG